MNATPARWAQAKRKIQVETSQRMFSNRPGCFHRLKKFELHIKPDKPNAGETLMKRAVFYILAAAAILLLAVGAYSRQDSRRLQQNAEIEKIERELDRLTQRAEQMAARLEHIKAAVPE